MKVDANKVIDQLSLRIAQLEKEKAILCVQLEEKKKEEKANKK